MLLNAMCLCSVLLSRVDTLPLIEIMNSSHNAAVNAKLAQDPCICMNVCIYKKECH